MQDLLVSLNKNVVRISTVDKNTVLRTTLVDVPKETADDTRVLDSVAFSQILHGLLPQISALSKNKLSLNFVVEPQDVILRFITLTKKEGDLDEQMIAELKEKAKDIPLDDLYFSYRKIAPFVYQFVGMKKEILEKYLEVSNHLGIGLKSVIPWVLALPKYKKVNEPAIFISKVGDRQVVALSELGGVFFAEVYEKEQTEIELQNLIKELSFYKRSSPISHVFIMNCAYLTLENYEIKKIEFPQFKDGTEVSPGYEQNVIVNFLLDTDADLTNSQINALNMLPVPVVETKSVSLVAVGSVFALLILVGGLFGGYLLLRERNKPGQSQLAQKNNEGTQVLSESSQNTDQSSQLKKEDLKIRVENGAGVSGLAERTQDFLKGFGYKVLSIDTASTNTAPTILQFKKANLNYSELIIKDIKDKFPNVVVKDDLSADKEYNLLIVVGTSSKL